MRGNCSDELLDPMSKAPAISFLICSWQAPESLDETLGSIARQHGLDRCETILVNNGFTQTRAEELTVRYPGINLQIIREERPGLGFARHTGFLATTGEAIVMLDDDNVLRGQFTHALLETCEKFPNWGGICARIEPVWQKPPPKWLEDFGKSCLSYNAVPSDPLLPEDRVWHFPHSGDAPRPPGGGMIVHRDVFQNYVTFTTESKRIGLDRTRNNLEGCQDADIYNRIAAVGKDAVQTQAVLIEHHIPASRVRFSYLARLNFQMTVSNAKLMRYWRAEGSPEVILPWYNRWWSLLMTGQSALRGKTPLGLYALLLCRELGYWWGAIVAHRP